MNFSRTADSGLPRIPASVVHMLADAAQARPAAPALSFEGTRLNYRQYAAVVAALAARWRPLVTPGARVALVMPNSLDLAVATFAVHALRAQVVALNPGYSARELSLMLEDAAPSLLVYDQGCKVDVAACCATLAAERIIAVSGGASFAALAEENQALPTDLPGHDDLATLQYTGGTTGRSKGVNISHRHLAYNLAQREALLPTEYGAETALCVMPLFHVSAVAMSLHLACYAASELIILRRFDVPATAGDDRIAPGDLALRCAGDLSQPGGRSGPAKCRSEQPAFLLFRGGALAAGSAAALGTIGRLPDHGGLWHERGRPLHDL